MGLQGHGVLSPGATEASISELDPVWNLEDVVVTDFLDGHSISESSVGSGAGTHRSYVFKGRRRDDREAEEEDVGLGV